MPKPTVPLRRKLLVDPELQIGISVQIVGWIYIYFLAFSLLANSPSLWAVLSSETRDAAYVVAMDQLRAFARYVILPLGLTFVAMAVHGIWITHRLAGPVVRFKQVLREIAAHRLPAPVALREKDHLKDVADEMNVAIGSLREDAVRRRRLAAEHLVAVEDLVRSLETAPDDLALALSRAYAVLDGAERLERQFDPSSTPVSSSPVPLADAELLASAADVAPGVPAATSAAANSANTPPRA